MVTNIDLTETLLVHMRVMSDTFLQAEELVRTIIEDTGLSGSNPVEVFCGIKPKYIDTIEGLIKQNEKQRKWLDERGQEIKILNDKIAEYKEQLSRKRKHIQFLTEKLAEEQGKNVQPTIPLSGSKSFPLIDSICTICGKVVPIQCGGGQYCSLYQGEVE